MRCFILGLFLTELSMAQGVLYPLAVGNRWHYIERSSSSSILGEYDVRVAGDTTFSNGKTYAILTGIDPFWTRGGYERYDSQKVYTYYPYDSTECLTYQFNLQYGNLTCDHIFIGEHSDTVMGRQLRTFSFNDYEPGWGENISDSFGVIFSYSDIGETSELTGARINGVTYGTFTDLLDHTGIPENRFVLSQNYPNPFNPSTSIPFRVPDVGWVNLSVFDLLGRQVATLVNEVKYPGEYTASWHPENLPSGAYFSRLRFGSRTKTKLMMYLR
jgi:hypothetical protein